MTQQRSNALPDDRQSDVDSRSALTIVSACLSGSPCRYDGHARPDDEIIDAVSAGRAISACAEQLGGLPTPRPAAEIVGGDGSDVLEGRARVVSAHGEDFTDAFIVGARQVADLAESRGITHAILQARSPSCGCTSIYDGTHSGQQRAGEGVLAAELKRRGITVEERAGSRDTDASTAASIPSA